MLCNISRQAHHQAIRYVVRQSEKELIYVGLMAQAREIHPGMGLRTMYDMVAPDGIGRDAFIALGLQEGYRLKVVENKTRTTYSIKSNRYTNLLGNKKFTDVNQLWSSDITYFDCLGRFYYLVFIMDVYSRRIVGYSIADNMRAENNFAALKMALNLRGISNYNKELIHHSDKGSQYVSDIYTQTLEEYGIQISMCTEVYENTHIERVNDTIKNQYLKRMEIINVKDLQQKTKQAIDAYNFHRPHQGLDGMSPVQYEERVKTIAQEKRKKMEIFTIKKNTEELNPNQLKLFNC